MGTYTMEELAEILQNVELNAGSQTWLGPIGGLAIALLAAALILFAAFYPLESGLPCSREYAKYLRWFEWYNY